MKTKITKKMEIYFDDLNQDAQQEYIEVIGAKTLDEINMITPIAIIEIENNIIDNNLSNSDTHHKTDCQILEADNNKANITGEPQFIDPADPANIGQFYEGGYIAGVIDS